MTKIGQAFKKVSGNKSYTMKTPTYSTQDSTTGQRYATLSAGTTVYGVLVETGSSQVALEGGFYTVITAVFQTETEFKEGYMLNDGTYDWSVTSKPYIVFYRGSAAYYNVPIQRKVT